MSNKIYLPVLIFLISISCKKAEEPTTSISANKTVEKTQTPLEASVKRGRKIYQALCVTCHLPSGKGVPGAFPPLNPSNWLTDKRTESIHAVKYGLKGSIEVNGMPYDNIMLPLGLSDKEVADVMNYSIQTWNKGEMVTLEEVQSVKK